MDTMDQKALKTRKLKLIIIAVLAAVVIFLVGIWAISIATNAGIGYQPIENPEVANTEDHQNGVEPTSPANSYNPFVVEPAPNAPTTPTTPTTQATNPAIPSPAHAPVATNMPTTGPAEVVFSALMLGVVAYLAALNVKFAREKRA
jgi:hypothetical protein